MFRELFNRVKENFEDEHGIAMKKEHPGAYCDKCGKTATEGEYSRGECSCGGSIVAESKVKEDVASAQAPAEDDEGEAKSQYPYRKPGKQGAPKGKDNMVTNVVFKPIGPQSADVLGDSVTARELHGAMMKVEEDAEPGKCTRCGKEGYVFKQKGHDTAYCHQCAIDIAKEELAKVSKPKGGMERDSS